MTRWIVLAGVLVAGCVFSERNTHNESFGPRVTNECDQQVITAIGDSLAAAELDIRESPITLQSGSRSYIEYIVQDDVVPERVFLLVGVTADDAAMVEMETAALRLVTVDLVFEADCLTLGSA